MFLQKLKLILQRANPYSKNREEDDPETEAFAKGELTKFTKGTKRKGSRSSNRTEGHRCI